MALTANARVGLVDRYGGSMPSGWTRYILEDFEFNFEVVYPPEIDAGNLNERFDVIILPDGAYSGGGGGGGGGGFRFGGQNQDFEASLPDSLRGRARPPVRRHERPGPTRVHRERRRRDRGRRLDLAGRTARPPARELHGRRPGRAARRATTTSHPGRSTTSAVEHGSPITHGLGDRVNILHSHSPVFQIGDGAA